MPANLTPQYYKAEARYKAATEDRERLAALREMLSIMPKHKGTEKLQADLKKKIRQLREKSGTKKGVRRAPSHRVERSGAAQVAIVGRANSGKSRLVADQTHAEPEVADFPYTTWTPTPGIVEVDHIPLQLVDLPPLTPEHTEPWLADLIRNADALLLFLSAGSDDVLDDWEIIVDTLDGMHVKLEPPPPEEERAIGVRYPKHVLAANKMDRPGARTRLELLREIVDDETIWPVSLETKEGLDELWHELVRVLDLIRVFTKQPHGKAKMDEPFVLRAGSTVEDAARGIHQELADTFKFARAWGKRFHDGQPVGRDTVLEDGDLLEFHE